MELAQLGKMLARRWVMLVVVVVIAAAGSIAVIRAVGPTYSAEGDVLLLPPQDSLAKANPNGTPANPYLFLGDLLQARDVLVRSLGSASSREEVKRAVPAGDFTVEPDATSSGPLVVVQTEAPTSEAALGTLTKVLKVVPDRLSRLQGRLSITGPAAITSSVVTQDTSAQVIRKSQIRLGIVAAVGLLTAGIILIALVDALLLRRREGKEAEPDSAAPSPGVVRLGLKDPQNADRDTGPESVKRGKSDVRRQR